jgi:hypothetical protein
LSTDEKIKTRITFVKDSKQQVFQYKDKEPEAGKQMSVLNLPKTDISEDSYSESNSDDESAPKNLNSGKSNNNKSMIIGGIANKQKLDNSKPKNMKSDQKLMNSLSKVLTDAEKLQLEKSESKPDISDYKTLGVLGEGSFGKVYHVVKKSDGSEFALKVINKKDCFDMK